MYCILFCFDYTLDVKRPNILLLFDTYVFDTYLVHQLDYLKKSYPK